MDTMCVILCWARTLGSIADSRLAGGDDPGGGEVRSVWGGKEVEARKDRYTHFPRYRASGRMQLRPRIGLLEFSKDGNGSRKFKDTC